MRRTFYLGCGLAAAACGALVFAHVQAPAEAQQPGLNIIELPEEPLADPDIVFAENPEQAAADKAAFDALEIAESLSEPVDDAFADEPQPQPLPTNRSRYLELLRRKAELMTDEQIEAELLEVTADIGELEASRKLEHIMTGLQTLVSEHPNSVAAKKARRMVETATMPSHEFDEATGGFRRVIEPDAPTYSAPSRASDDDAGFQVSPSRPTPADRKGLPTY